jgi:hypothetical protein
MPFRNSTGGGATSYKMRKASRPRAGSVPVAKGCSMWFASESGRTLAHNREEQGDVEMSARGGGVLAEIGTRTQRQRSGKTLVPWHWAVEGHA